MRVKSSELKGGFCDMLNEVGSIRDILSRLRAEGYADVIHVLRGAANKLKDGALADELEALRVAYHEMVHYAVLGIEDASREGFVRKLRERLFEICWELNDRVLEGGGTFVAMMRASHPVQQPIGEIVRQLRLAEEKEHVDRLLSETMDGVTGGGSVFEPFARRSELFSAIVTKGVLTAEECEEIAGLLKEEDGEVKDEALLAVTALTFSELHHPQREKIKLLYECLQGAKSVPLRVRALVGMYMLDLHDGDALALYGQQIWGDEMRREQNEYDEVAMSFVRARYTEYLGTLLQKEVFDNLQALAPQMEERWRKSQEEDGDEEDRMDDMEELFEETGLSKKLQKMTEMVHDGDDVYYANFRYLKSYAFFNNPINWLIPFRKDNPHVLKELPEKLKDVLGLLESNHYMCDSDRYSLVFTLKQMGGAQMEMMVQQLNDEIAQVRDEMKDSEVVDGKAMFKREVANYVQMLYRFVQSAHYYQARSESPRRNRGPALFGICDCSYLSAGALLRMVDKMYAYAPNDEGVLGEMEEVLDYLCEEKPSLMAWKKAGFCKERLEQDDKAIECYLEADKLAPNNRWTLMHLAACYERRKLEGDAEKAIACYDGVLAMDGDDVRANEGKARLLQYMGRNEEALAQWFKVNYMDENNEEAVRGIAILSAYMGKKEQALRYFDKNIEMSGSADAVSLKGVFCYAYELTKKEEALAILRQLPSPVTSLYGVDELEVERLLKFPVENIKEYLNSL